jgi:hypothetical protein
MREFGCDISESSSPNLAALPGVFNTPGKLADWKRNLRLGVRSGSLKLYDYEEGCRLMEQVRPAHPHIPGFFVGWDNTARRGRKAIVLTNSTPEAFARGLRLVLNSVSERPPEHRIVFLNAWNEWAEGMCLEPGQLHGHKFLEAVKAELAHINV